MPPRVKSKSAGISGIYRCLLVHRLLFSAFLCLFALILSACTEIEKPKAEPFFVETAPPAKQEFRWSNGKSPKSLDPARASAAPETDIVRALFEGLTETDPKTLQEISGVAEKWSSSEDFRVWTFNLRKNAKWSNGKPVTAHDFVRSWRRLAEMGEKAAHNNLLNNIAGVPLEAPDTQSTSDGDADLLLNSATNQSLPLLPEGPLDLPPANSHATRPQTGNRINANSNSAFGQNGDDTGEDEKKLGFIAEDDLTLKVSLVLPDKDFPKLVANPIFRPIFGDGSEFESSRLDTALVTNGAFRIFDIGERGVSLERSENYWNREAIALERVRFVPMENAERALEAYRAGDLDAITNVEFAPLALKLLSSYNDFRRTTHSALNFYDVNIGNPPFSDRRVRQALSNAIERERLTEGEMEGLTRPALNFLPFGTGTKRKLSQDKEKARELLDEAGFPAGENFPTIRLLVNRNDTQQRLARSVARMWKQNLNLDTEIIVKDTEDLETARRVGDFDLVRRGVVLPTSDEMASFTAIFDSAQGSKEDPPGIGEPEGNAADAGQNAGQTNSDSEGNGTASQKDDPNPDNPNPTMILTEEAAMYELRAIPLYFSTSYSLVKPYVSGFEMNGLDALSLSNVIIDNNWQPDTTSGES